MFVIIQQDLRFYCNIITICISKSRVGSPESVVQTPDFRLLLTSDSGRHDSGLLDPGLRDPPHLPHANRRLDSHPTIHGKIGEHLHGGQPVAVAAERGVGSAAHTADQG